MPTSLGDLLDRYIITAMKLQKIHEEGGVRGPLADDVQELRKEIEGMKATITPHDLIAAVQLGAANGRIWAMNDWTRQHPNDIKYWTVMKLNDHRRYQVRALNEGALS